MPHILMLFNDANKTIVAPLEARKNELKVLKLVVCGGDALSLDLKKNVTASTSTSYTFKNQNKSERQLRDKAIKLLDGLESDIGSALNSAIGFKNSPSYSFKGLSVSLKTNNKTRPTPGTASGSGGPTMISPNHPVHSRPHR